MNRLIFALALAPALLATGARAQTVSDDVAKELWCGEAFIVYFGNQQSVPPDRQAVLEAYQAASVKLVDQGSQAYLDAGFTEEQVAKIKADLVAEVTPVVTTGAEGKFTPNDCQPLLAPFMPPEPSAPDASVAPSDASSSAQ